MTIVEALSRLARHHPRKDFSALTAPEVGDALQALNAGIQELYQGLTPALRRQTVELNVAAPVSVVVRLVAGSDVVQLVRQDVFVASGAGSSVVDGTYTRANDGLFEKADAYCFLEAGEAWVFGDGTGGADLYWSREVAVGTMPWQATNSIYGFEGSPPVQKVEAVT